LEAGFRIGQYKPVLVIIDEIDGATGAGENVSEHEIALLRQLNLLTDE
jgi:chromosome transmission fidelity protein 18